jgi:spore germination protein YaaH
MKRLSCLMLLAFFTCCVKLQAAPVALFYLINQPNSIRSFVAHADKVDLLVPMWYSTDANGLVTGAAEPLVMKTAKEHHVPVMPIITIENKDSFHSFLTHPATHQTMIDALIQQCKINGYTGIQFDFEDIAWTDRDNLSALVKETAAALHKEGLQLTIATVPNAPGYPGAGGFAKWIWQDWRGAYDLEALAKSVDLICLMTYDQHTRWTSPGPVGGWNWTVENMKYALRFVPKEKLSLGIALYGYHWYTDAPTKDKDGQLKPNPTADYIDGIDTLQLAQAYDGKIQWDPVDHSAWFYFYRDQMREWIFYTDAHTFSDRYKLLQENGLQGFCSWVLGAEDPGIWSVLPSHQ